MKNFRTIYCIEAMTNAGELISRRYARNLRTAEKIARSSKTAHADIRKLQKCEHLWVASEWVEG